MSERCVNCGKTNVWGVEYTLDSPEHYDGISEWRCCDCGTRWGRWTGRILVGDDREKASARFDA